METENNQKTSIKFYLPLVFLLIMLFTFLAYLKRALLWNENVRWLLYEYGVYLPLIGLVIFAPLLLGHIRHRSWRFYLPLILPVACIVFITINFYLAPRWVIKEHPEFSQTASLEEIASSWQDPRYFIIRDYLKGKTLIIPYLGGFFDSLLFELIVNNKVEFKKYPYILTDEEFGALNKKPKSGRIGWLRKKWLSLLRDTSHTDKIYITYYKNDQILFLPEDIFLKMNGKTGL